MKRIMRTISTVCFVGPFTVGLVSSFQSPLLSSSSEFSSLSSPSPSSSLTFLSAEQSKLRFVQRRARLHAIVSKSSLATSQPPTSRLWRPFDDLSNKSSGRGDFRSAKFSSPGVAFFKALNNGDIDEALSYIIDDAVDDEDGKISVKYEDTDFPNAWHCKEELERNLRLLAQVPSNPTFVVDDTVYDPSTRKEGVVFHLENPVDGAFLKKGVAFFELAGKAPFQIQKAFIVKENQKDGESSLKILKVASDIICAATWSSPTKKAEIVSMVDAQAPGKLLPANNIFSRLFPFDRSPSSPLASSTLPEQYFAGWNDRDMERACSVFSDDIEYDDTAFPAPFTGKDALERHLNVCADSMPTTFSFVLDDQVNDGDKVVVKWHVENGSDELPFTRGCSFYEIYNDKIVAGTDWKEPAVLKTAGVSLFVESTLSKLQEEPIRLIPLVVWITYLYVVFFSDGFFGVPVQSLETRTWEEVRDLSLNFFFVSPILGLPFAPVVHPGLEGIFNLLLSWAALFAGFLSDDRRKKPNILPMFPIVVGMQFLTSAFLLPYLVTRSKEVESNISREELTPVAQVTESRLLGVAMGIVGTGSIFWGLLARTQDFGEFPERLFSLIELLTIDRVGSSFVVDLVIFGLFQGWLVDDDLERRGMDTNTPMAKAAKYLPFFGMASYLTFRSQLSTEEKPETERKPD